MNNFTSLLDFLKQEEEKKIGTNNDDANTDLSYGFIDKNPLLKSLVRSFERFENHNDNYEYEFMQIFIDTIISNLTKSNNHRRYGTTIKNFALSLHIIGGKLTYEFIRLNLPGSLPNLAMLNALMSSSDSKFSEGEFGFDQLEKRCNNLGVQYAFASEDATDATHLVTKWRNRLLSSSAALWLENKSISINHLYDIINNEHYSTLDHGLTKFDINPQDRQNFSSCLKLAFHDLINILSKNNDTRGTLICLQMFRMIIVTYVEKRMTVAEHTLCEKKYFISGLRSAWTVVFLCTAWLTWIKCTSFNSSYTTRNNKSKYFITRPAYLSMEINAHNLLYLIILIKEKKLPPSVLHIDIFSLQACESLFRNARALSGIYPTIVNFTIHDFLRRAQRLSILSDIKHMQSDTDLVNNFIFPAHHKHRSVRHAAVMINQYEIDQIDIEKLITGAYDKAIQKW
ncbi:unnamed protein product [Adineta ricciae]|uniref:Uncharacterized protein n=1 Tax=Adineta ricciae TaxID=249248 RepID=A0A815LBS1_ADIRI|nr:unnamed protein product [Adineta ricciae]CAF1405857.1 unnamed protein product [Adineta ricciae]